MAARPRRRTPLLGRLGVGAKLMLLVLLPVGVLLGFTIVGGVDNWREASSLSDFRSATEESFLATDLTSALADERTATALAILRPADPALPPVRPAQASVDAALQQGNEHARAWEGPVDVEGRLDAARRQLNAVRVAVASGSLTAPASADAYSSMVRNLLGTVWELNAAGPTRPSARAAGAYVAIVEAIEAAERERVDVAALLATPTPAPLAASDAARWSVLEAAHLDAFRQIAAGPLVADLEAVQFSPSGIAVTSLRDDLTNRALGTWQEPPLTAWVGVSGTRIAALRDLQAGARENLAAAASDDLAAARARGFRDLGISLAVLLLVAALALRLRRSITRPLREVSEGAQSLSRGDLAVDICYRGRDEIAHVASAFRTLHLTVERLAQEIRDMTGAVRDNRLEHRADVSAFRGTWSHVLTGLNETMTAVADAQCRRERAERELGDFFELSLDLLCIVDFEGRLTRVNPAFERTLGYPAAELTSRPFVEFIHPDDRQRTAEAFDSQRGGDDIVGFENRCLCSDGSTRWLQWSSRPLTAGGFACAVARDVTERRHSAEEQAALRRVATLVAEGACPAETFSAVAAEMGQLFGVDAAAVFRYERGREATLVGGWSVPGIALPIGTRLGVTGSGVAVRVLHTRRPARTERFEGPAGSIPAFFRSFGVRAGVGAPITVEGELWGVLVVVSTVPERLPAGSELGIARFTDLLASAIANAEARKELRRVADEQAALRRVAVLVARGASPEKMFAAVAEEVARQLPADHANLLRYDAGDAVTWVAGRDPDIIGTRAQLGGRNIATMVLEAGRPARIDDYARASGAPADLGRGWGFRAAVGAPIRVEGRLWGVMITGSNGDGPLPADTEVRLAGFTELIATAVANAQARLELRGFAEEQAALRRMATLVARGAQPDAVFAAVTAEVGRLLSVEFTFLGRYDQHGEAAVVMHGVWTASGTPSPVPVGQRLTFEEGNVTEQVFRTHRSARIDRYETDGRRSGQACLATGLRSAVAAPIRVQGRLWGVIIAGSTQDEPLPADTEARLAGFTELVATAIANAEAQAQLTASRARIVVAADHARRRIERDLHDGAQQRLVSVALRLRAAQAEVPPEAGDLAGRLDGLVGEVTSALDELRELARGIHPPVLAEGGLRPALKALARRCCVPVELDVRVAGRLPEQIEIAAYYVVAEALTNVAKHAAASTVTVTVEPDAAATVLRVAIRDDGAGGAAFTRGTGLVGLKDRVEALRGKIFLDSPRGAGTRLLVELPLTADGT